MSMHTGARTTGCDRLTIMRKPFEDRLPPILKGMMGRLLNIAELEELHRRLCLQPISKPFWDELLDCLGIDIRVDYEDARRIPRHGPVVVVANHPFGAIEGLALGSLLRSVRQDVKIMANSVLHPIEGLRDLFICVDAFGGRDATYRNYQPLRDAVRWLQHGGLLAGFPAGEVAHLHVRHGTITDPPWKETMTRLARRQKTPVLPVYFCGSNSMIFQMLGLLHPRLRTALLVREMLNKRNCTLEIRIGNLIPAERLKAFSSDREATDYLRRQTFLLQHRNQHCFTFVSYPGPSETPSRIPPISAAADPEILAAEIERLDGDNLLLQQGDLQVLHARAWEIPLTLREIGRQREIAFRTVGEGTGNECDLDRFDEEYEHIFLWDTRQRAILGAYRIGRTDHILRKNGVEGLYVNSLFRLRRSFFQRLGPALELGRSFVRTENRCDSKSLPMLWSGIARYVARRPKYRYLYGPVSISSDYRPISRQLITWFLKTHHPAESVPFEVKPMSPPSFSRRGMRAAKDLCRSVRDLDDLSDIISCIEPDSKGVPVLLRHYIRLGAKVLAFNVDPAFRNCLDALVLVDLACVEQRILERLMGKNSARYFRLMHDCLTPEEPKRSSDPPGDFSGSRPVEMPAAI